MIERDGHAALTLRNGNAGTVLYRHRLLIYGIQSPGRTQRVSKLAADLTYFGDWQERRHGQKRQQRQQRTLKRSGIHQNRTGDHHRKPAQPGNDIQQLFLQREIREKRKTNAMMFPGPKSKFFSPIVDVIKGDHLGKTLHAINGMGVELAQRLASTRAHLIDALSEHERAQRHDRQKRQQDKRHKRPKINQYADNDRGNQYRNKSRGNRVRKEIFHELNVVGGHAHHITRSATNHVRRRKLIELLKQRDAHLRQQPKRHIVGYP